MSEITFTVLGLAQPAGSKKAFVNPKTGRAIIVDDAKKSKPWKQEVAGAALDALAGREMLAGPLSVDLRFYRGRPKGHYGSGRNAEVLKLDAPCRPITKPDVDKLSRAMLDGMTGVVYRDDAQIVEKRAAKFYGYPERVEVVVSPLVAA